MAEQHFSGVKVGPFVSGTIRERKPSTPTGKLVTWVIVVLLIMQAAPAAGVLLILGTAVVLAGYRHSDERNTDDRSE